MAGLWDVANRPCWESGLNGAFKSQFQLETVMLWDDNKVMRSSRIAGGICMGGQWLFTPCMPGAAEK